jgi:hypothetical protein
MMKRSLMMSTALPLVLIGCPSDSGEDELGDDDGISTLGDTTDSGDTTTTTTENDTFDTESSETADTTDTTTGMDCGMVSIVPTYVPPNVMLVVDASGSMISNLWDHDQNMATPNVTRWNTLYGVVEIVMNNFGGAMNSGLQRFPSADACPNATPQSSNCYNADACIVNDTPEVAIGPDNAAAILASIPGANANNVEVVGGTPAVAGFTSALAHLLTQPEGLPNYVLLITDGAANCVDGLPFPEFIETYDEGLQLAVGDAYTNEGIPTFVVGIDILDALVGQGNDGSPYANAYEELNEVALAGGVPKNMGMDADKFFNTTNQQELLDAIQGILGEVTDCTIDLTMTEEGPPAPSQIPYVTFEVDGMLVPYVEDCETEAGWTWIVEGEIMTFCGSYCDDFKNGTAEFDGTYGCPPSG